MLNSQSLRKFLQNLVVAISVAFASAAPSLADDQGFEKMRLAVQNALWRHQEVRDVHFHSQGWYLAGVDSNHEFHIKPPTVRKLRDGRTSIYGQISREKRARKDDQYYYKIEFNESGSVLVFSERINDNSRRFLIGRQVRDSKKIGVSLRGDMKHSDCRKFVRELNSVREPYKTYYGNYDSDAWQSGARCIVLTIAAEAYSGRSGSRRDFRDQ